jgi:hypothetical protein
MKRPLIVEVLRAPARLGELAPAGWELLLRQASAANLSATLYCLAEREGVLNAIPAAPRRHLEWARSLAARQDQAVHFEVDEIARALRRVGVQPILLKGAAYVLADLPAARGRLFSDIDILVPKARLPDVESALMLHGWGSTHHDPYDQRYYRQWMHELPPLEHIRRRTVLDVHHALVPQTASIRPEPALLHAAARTLPHAPALRVLAPADMALHSAVHLFHGEFEHGLRDLLDLHALLGHFGADPVFWTDLPRRAQELELTRELFYALRYCRLLLDTAIPDQALAAAAPGRPARPLLALMDALLTRALLPRHPSCADRFSPSARFLLYLRANWLRMPPLLLSRHLFHKAFLSPRTAE